MRACQAKVLEYAETAMALSMAGNPTAAVKNLILHGRETHNARLIDNAHQVIQNMRPRSTTPRRWTWKSRNCAASMAWPTSRPRWANKAPGRRSGPAHRQQALRQSRLARQPRTRRGIDG